MHVRSTSATTSLIKKIEVGGPSRAGQWNMTVDLELNICGRRPDSDIESCISGNTIIISAYLGTNLSNGTEFVILTSCHPAESLAGSTGP